MGLLKLDAKLPQVYLYFNDNGSGMAFAALSSNAPKSGSGHARCPYSRPDYMHYNTIEECNTCEKIENDLVGWLATGAGCQSGGVMVFCTGLVQ